MEEGPILEQGKGIASGKSKVWEEDKNLLSNKKDLCRETAGSQLDLIEHRQVRDAGEKKRIKGGKFWSYFHYSFREAQLF